MYASEAVLAVERLIELVDQGPGRNEAAESEVRAIVERLEDFSGESYFTKRLTRAFKTFETWWSPPSWAPMGNDPEFLRNLLDEDLKQLRFVVQSAGRAKAELPPSASARTIELRAA